MNRILKEELIRARLNHLGFDLEREPGGFDGIVRDRRERKECMQAVPATRCQELDTIVEFFGIELGSLLGWEMSEADVPIRFSPIFWRARAEEARTVAEGLNHDVAKLVLLKIAEDYEHLAKWFEDGSKTTFPRPDELK